MEAIFSVLCKGRGPKAREVLEKAVQVEVSVSQLGDSTIDLSVKCPYNTGGHGQRCKASHPDCDKKGRGVPCAYSIDVPYALDSYRRRR